MVALGVQPQVPSDCRASKDHLSMRIPIWSMVYGIEYIWSVVYTIHYKVYEKWQRVYKDPTKHRSEQEVLPLWTLRQPKG